MENTNLGPAPSPEADPTDLGAAVRAVLEAVREGGGPMRVSEIAEAVGSHENTVRSHLGQLIDRSLVVATTAPAEGRGRPATLYEAGPRPGARTEEYQALAGAFAADLVQRGKGPAVRARAREIGRSWGERMHAPRSEGAVAIEAAMADLGFSPRRDGDTLRLTTCPLLDLAVENPEVICQVHLGLVDGLLGTEAKGDAELTPFAEPGACLLRVPGH